MNVILILPYTHYCRVGGPPKGYVVKLVGPALIGRRAYVQFALLMKVGSSSRSEIRTSNRRTRQSSLVTGFDHDPIVGASLLTVGNPRRAGVLSVAVLLSKAACIYNAEPRDDRPEGHVAMHCLHKRPLSCTLAGALIDEGPLRRQAQASQPAVEHQVA